MFLKITILLVVECGLFLSAAYAQDVDCSKRPERVDPRTCCTVPEMISTEIKEKCKEFAPSGLSDESKVGKGPPHHGPPHHGPHHHNPCFMECILNVTEVYVNDELDEDKLAEILEDANDIQPIVVEAFATCAAKSKEHEAKREEWMKNKPPPPAGDNDKMMGPKCNPRSGFLLTCVKMESFKNCPSDRWNDSQQCNDLRDHMNNCKPEDGPHGKLRGPDAGNK